MSTSSISNGGGGFARQMSGATSTTSGVSGAVPTPNAGDHLKALLGSGLWGEISGADTVQQINTTSVITAWNSIVEIGATPLVGNITLTLPTCASNIGKKIVLKRLDAANFTVTVVAFAGQTVEVTTTDLNTQYGAIILEVVSATKSSQIANLGGYVASEYGNVSLNSQVFSTNSFVDSTNGIYNLPSAGVWVLTYDLLTDGTGSNTNSHVAITDSANVIVASSEKTRAGSFTSAQMLTTSVIVTTTGAATYKIRGRNGGSGSFTLINTVNIGAGNITWQKISGYLPVEGQSVDYSGVEQHSVGTATNLTSVVSTNVTTSGTLLTTANRVTLAGADISGNLTVNTANGTIAIAKNGIYNIVISVNTQSAGANGQWGQLVKNNATVISTTSAYNQISSASLQVVFSYTGTFAIGDLIDIRLNANSSGTIGITGYSYSVIQVGSTALVASPNSTPVVQTFTASSTYTPTPGMKWAVVEAVGGGGGGGGAPLGNAGQVYAGVMGSAGAYVKAMLTSAQIGTSQTVTIGTGGAGATGLSGPSGGTATTLGTLLSAGGCPIGGATSQSSTVVINGASPGGTFTITTGTDLGSKNGEQGAVAMAFNSADGTRAAAGSAGSTPLGIGAPGYQTGPNINSVNGVSASANTGGGGQGARSNNTASTFTGGNGGSGKMIITEYFGAYQAI